jgi:hypothetical protein
LGEASGVVSQDAGVHQVRIEKEAEPVTMYRKRPTAEDEPFVGLLYIPGQAGHDIQDLVRLGNGINVRKNMGVWELFIARDSAWAPIEAGYVVFCECDKSWSHVPNDYFVQRYEQLST